VPLSQPFLLLPPSSTLYREPTMFELGAVRDRVIPLRGNQKPHQTDFSSATRPPAIATDSFYLYERTILLSLDGRCTAQCTVYSNSMEALSCPPPGGDSNDGPKILVLTWIECSIALVFVCARLFTRIKLVCNLGWDDWTMAFTWVSSTVLFGKQHIPSGC